MDKKITRKNAERLDLSGWDKLLLQVREEHSENQKISFQIAKNVLAYFNQNQFCVSNDPTEKKSIEIIKQLDVESLALAICNALESIKELPDFLKQKLPPEHFRNEVLALKDCLQTARKKMNSFAIYDFLIGNDNEVEIISLMSQLEETIKKISFKETQIKSFLGNHFEFRYPQILSRVCNVKKNRTFFLLLAQLNRLESFKSVRLQTFFLHHLGQIVAQEISAYKKDSLIFQIVAPEDPTVLAEILKSKTWKSLSRI